eukprot:3362294-Rhodomonas_salina.1
MPAADRSVGAEQRPRMTSRASSARACSPTSRACRARACRARGCRARGCRARGCRARGCRAKGPRMTSDTQGSARDACVRVDVRVTSRARSSLAARALA